MKEKLITAELLKQYARFELLWDDILEGAVPEDNYRISGRHTLTLEDLLVALNNIRSALIGGMELTVVSDWVHRVFFVLDDRLLIPMLSEKEKYSDSEILFVSILDYLRRIECLGEGTSLEEYLSVTAIDKIISDAELFSKGIEIKPWRWSDIASCDFLDSYDEAQLDAADEETVEELRELAINLRDKGYIRAMEIIGYSYYGGNRMFPCDWEKARDAFTELMKERAVTDSQKCFYANTLGYIYYYGRCNDGSPEYDKAFKYFSLGAAGGVYESMYKLADMYLYGYGTEINTRAAENLITLLWRENLKHIEGGDFGCKFADVALRLGKLCKEGIIDDDAYYYYTLADYALHKRMSYKQFGDNKVYAVIQRELERIRKTRPLEKARTLFNPLPSFFFEALKDDYACLFSFRQVKDGINISAKRLPKANEDEAPRFFICLPEQGYCELADSVSLTALSGEASNMLTWKNLVADNISVFPIDEERCRAVFTHHDAEVARIEYTTFRYKLPKAKE